jgi:PhnB protein
MHAEIKIGDSPIMLTDESAEHPDWKSPLARGGSPVHIYLYVDDPATPYQKALDIGAKVLMELKEQPYGDRVGGVIDPFGHVWYIATSMRA